MRLLHILLPILLVASCSAFSLSDLFYSANNEVNKDIIAEKGVEQVEEEELSKDEENEEDDEFDDEEEEDDDDDEEEEEYDE